MEWEWDGPTERGQLQLETGLRWAGLCLTLSYPAVQWESVCSSPLIHESALETPQRPMRCRVPPEMRACRGNSPLFGRRVCRRSSKSYNFVNLIRISAFKNLKIFVSFLENLKSFDFKNIAVFYRCDRP